jgi:outer membrane protein
MKERGSLLTPCFCIMQSVMMFVLSGNADLGAQELLTLEDAIQLTLQHNYSILIARDNMQIAGNNYSPGNAGFLPNLDLYVTYNQSSSNSEQDYLDPSRPNLNRRNAISTTKTAGTALSWTVFDGFKMFAAYSRLGRLHKMERYKLQQQIEDKISQVILSYYDVVRKKLILQVDREAVAISEQRLRIVEQGYELGVSSNLDVLQARVDLNSDRSVLLSQEVDIADAQSNLQKIIARPEQRAFAVNDTIDVHPVLQIDSLLSNLFYQNIDLLIGQQEVEVAKFQRREVMAARYPTLNLTTGYNYNRSESQTGIFEMNEAYGYILGAYVSLNLFNGFNTYREEQNSRLTKRNKQFALEELKQNLTHDFNNLVLKYRNSLQRMQMEEENVQVALENVTIALERYQLGTITPLQLREVQRNYISAKSRFISTAYEVKQNQVYLLRLCGELIKEQ